MKYCLGLSEFNCSFREYIRFESGASDEKLSERLKLLNIFFDVFDLRKDLISEGSSARLSEWKKIFVNVLTKDMIKKINELNKFHYGWQKYDLSDLFKILTNANCYTNLADHSRVFLTKNNEPVLIATVYQTKKAILMFAKEHGLENFILDIVEVLNWRNPRIGSCLVLFNTNANLQERFNLYKEKAQPYYLKLLME